MSHQMSEEWGIHSNTRVPLLGLPMTSLPAGEDRKCPFGEDRVDSGFDSGYGLSLSLSEFKSKDSLSADLVQDFYTMSLSQTNDPVTHIPSDLVTQIFQRDEDGDTQLHLAIIHERADITMQMIDLAPSGKQLSLQNQLRQTPLHLAACMGQAEAAQRLVSRGAILETQDHSGNTALHVACRRGDVACVKALTSTERLQDPEMRNYDGQTCVHVAAAAGHVEVVVVLLARLGADVNAAEGRSGRTILHTAVEMRCLPVLALCLRLPCVNVNATTFSGATPLSLAMQRGHLDVTTALVARGAATTTTPYESDSESCCSDVTDEYMDL